MGDDDETLGLKIIKKTFEYGYVKAKDDNFYQQKTSWCLAPYGYVSDAELEGVHKVAFKCKTKQDQKTFKYVIIEADKVTNFTEVRKQVMKQVGGSFIFGDLSQPLWKRMMLSHMDVFVQRCFKLLRPIRNAGYQLQFLRGEDRWKEENVEAFFDPAVGVLGCDGQPKKDPQSIYDPLIFPSNQPLGKYLLRLIILILNVVPLLSQTH